jgi:hypothetical protein
MGCERRLGGHLPCSGVGRRPAGAGSHRQFRSEGAPLRIWRQWIAKELEALGHTPHVHEWEIKGGEDIYAWRETRHDAADQCSVCLG